MVQIAGSCRSGHILPRRVIHQAKCPCGLVSLVQAAILGLLVAYFVPLKIACKAWYVQFVRVSKSWDAVTIWTSPKRKVYDSSQSALTRELGKVLRIEVEEVFSSKSLFVHERCSSHFLPSILLASCSNLAHKPHTSSFRPNRIFENPGSASNQSCPP